ncbi:MAG: RNA-binding protein [Candidatus Aquicultor primus]|uniref:RNA-binding protein n=1 Tax=Candidatus Aquicultor primus TaxID=1797195 RepID=A0A1F2UJ19_9ACTN|nr:MAG: RNA-binding protein [Candidatus Aquicultor primus]
MREVAVEPGTKLEQLLKYTDLASTGGEAKYLIQSGLVRVNGKKEIRRGYKIKEGDIVEIEDEVLNVSLLLK